MARSSSDRSDITRDVDINPKGPFAAGLVQHADTTGMFVSHRIPTIKVECVNKSISDQLKKRIDRKNPKKKKNTNLSHVDVDNTTAYCHPTTPLLVFGLRVVSAAC